MHTSEIVLIYNSLLHVLATGGHLQGGETKHQKLKDDAIIEVKEPAQGVKWQ